MPICELEKKWWGMNFNIAAEEMRRLKNTPNDEDRLECYSLYKQAVHGDIPDYAVYKRPNEENWDQKKWDAWNAKKGMTQETAKSKYVKHAEDLVKKCNRKIERSQWNSEVWSVDY